MSRCPYHHGSAAWNSKLHGAQRSSREDGSQRIPRGAVLPSSALGVAAEQQDKRSKAWRQILYGCSSYNVASLAMLLDERP